MAAPPPSVLSTLGRMRENVHAVILSIAEPQLSTKCSFFGKSHHENQRRNRVSVAQDAGCSLAVSLMKTVRYST